MGIYAYSPDRGRAHSRGRFDFPDVVLALIAAGEQVCKFEFTGPWYDIGTAGELLNASAAFTEQPGVFDPGYRVEHEPVGLIGAFRPFEAIRSAEKVVGDHARTYGYGWSEEALVDRSRDTVRTAMVREGSMSEGYESRRQDGLPDRESQLVTLWRVVRERWRVVAATTVLCVVATLAVSLTSDKTYDATSRLVFEGPGARQRRHRRLTGVPELHRPATGGGDEHGAGSLHGGGAAGRRRSFARRDGGRPARFRDDLGRGEHRHRRIRARRASRSHPRRRGGGQFVRR